MAMRSTNVTSSSRRSAATGSRASRYRGPGQRTGDGEGLARALGWFSIGLGLAEVVAPRRLARLIGTPDRPALIRGFGLREIASGVGILTQRRPTPWVWSRVAGDVMDLSALGAAFGASRADGNRIAFATAAVAGVTALDVRCATALTRTTRADRGIAADGSVRFEKSIRINASPEDLYAFWHEFQNLARFMRHLEAVRITGERRSHWIAKGPAGVTVEWDAETITDVPNEAIAWRSLEGADVDNRGSVRFERALNGRGTIMRVDIQYGPPGGKLGSVIAGLFGTDPRQQVAEDLRRFKQLVETGEIPTTEGQPAGHAYSPSAGRSPRRVEERRNAS